MKRAAVAMLGVLLALRAARADDAPAAKPSYRVVVDRVHHEPASITGTRLEITMSALTLQGQLIDLTDPKTIRTLIGGRELKAPYALGTFAGTKDAIALVVVVQSSVDYTEVLPVIAETLDGSLLAKLDETTTQVAILPYGEAIGAGKLGSMKSARSKATGLVNDGTTGDMALLETIERGLSLLKRAKTEPEGQPLRKVIVVISDGRERGEDRDRVTRLGTRANKEGVRIHSFAYSPHDARRPLLNLGELSKRSFGTFRWLQRGKADSWAPAFDQLRDEILKQYVLTYYLSADDDPARKMLKVTTVGRIETTSNEMKIPEPVCNGEPCEGYCSGTVCAIALPPQGRGIVGWILLIGGIGLGGLLLLVGIGFVLSKRSPKIPLPPGMTLPMKPGAMPPGVVPGAPPPVVAAPVVAAGPCLLLLSGPRTGERIPLKHGFAIGKAQGSDLQIDDGYTSNHHAQFTLDHFGNCRVYDLGSTNGTFVNGVRVQGEAVLDSGASLRIGSTELRFLAQ
ncbi:MAG: FHA domain-containing protein [Deltaproteobacteria bacterium]|nr:FHA domain-containing protein [Deltaproteobacteria bacterium]